MGDDGGGEDVCSEDKWAVCHYPRGGTAFTIVLEI